MVILERKQFNNERSKEYMSLILDSENDFLH